MSIIIIIIIRRIKVQVPQSETFCPVSKTRVDIQRKGPLTRMLFLRSMRISKVHCSIQCSCMILCMVSNPPLGEGFSDGHCGGGTGVGNTAQFWLTVSQYVE